SGAGYSQWAFRNAGGTFYLATTTVAGTATSTTAALTIDSTNKVTFGNANATCIGLTGSAALCDGDDASSAGGAAIYNWSTTTSTLNPNAIFANGGNNTLVGIGTSTPMYQLTIASSTGPQLSLSAGAGIAQWTFRNAGGNLYFATTTVAGTATTTQAALSITSTGQLSIGTTTAGTLKTTSAGLVYVDTTADAVEGVTVTVFDIGQTGTNWTKSNYSNLKFTEVIATGGGGGGGGANGDGTNEQAAGGGGAGGTSISMIAAATLGSTETVTVGARGIGGTSAGGNGGSGGNSSMDGVLALGGTNGTGDSSSATCTGLGSGGAGGATTTATGDIKLAGGDGSSPSACIAESAAGGMGGASYWGGGGEGGVAFGSGSIAGATSTAYGAGGGGAANVDGNATAASGGGGGAGVVVTMNYTSTGGDLAEWYETKLNVEAGDVVAIGDESYEYDSKLGLQKSSVLEKASSSNSVVGVISFAPYLTMGGDILGNAKHPQKVALAGRVPVKFSGENGSIKAGDMLTVSSVPGVAMRATKAGVTIGKALEDKECAEGSVCTVLVMVHTGYSTGALLKVAYRDDGILLDNINGDINAGRDTARAILARNIQDKKDIRATSTLSEIFTDRVVAGLEVITPRVVTDTLVTSVIEPVGNDVTLRLLEDGRFSVERVGTLSTSFGSTTATSTDTVISFDSAGNAFFAGNVIANGFNIGGFEDFQNQLASTTVSIDSLTINASSTASTTEAIFAMLSSVASSTDDLRLNIETIASTTASSTPESELFAERFFNNIFSKVTTWLASAANGIGDLFVNRVRTKELCVSDESGAETCITKNQLDALISNAISAAPDEPVVEEPPVEEPVVEEPPVEEPIVEEPPVEEPVVEEPPVEEPVVEEPPVEEPIVEEPPIEEPLP
ncbi:MAG: hypothetical protein WAX80_02130, partial [Minisyncoccia bacterium]